jgi:hypothetical protein
VETETDSRSQNDRSLPMISLPACMPFERMVCGREALPESLKIEGQPDTASHQCKRYGLAYASTMGWMPVEPQQRNAHPSEEDRSGSMNLPTSVVESISRTRQAIVCSPPRLTGRDAIMRLVLCKSIYFDGKWPNQEAAPLGRANSPEAR